MIRWEKLRAFSNHFGLDCHNPYSSVQWKKLSRTLLLYLALLRWCPDCSREGRGCLLNYMLVWANGWGRAERDEKWKLSWLRHPNLLGKWLAENISVDFNGFWIRHQVHRVSKLLHKKGQSNLFLPQNRGKHGENYDCLGNHPSLLCFRGSAATYGPVFRSDFKVTSYHYLVHIMDTLYV